MTLGRTGALADLTQTVTLPAGGGGAGGLTEENILLNATQDTTATEHTLLEEIEAGSWYQFDLADASGARAQAFMSGAQILRTTAQSATPGTTSYFVGASARTHRVTNTSGSADTFFVWKSDEALKLWVRTAQLQDGMLNIFKLTPAGGGGGGTGTDTNDYVDALTTAVNGTTLSVTLGRTGSLADLTSNVTLPSTGGGFSLQQIQDAMVAFLNFGSNITATYDDPNNVYNINSAEQLCEPSGRNRPLVQRTDNHAGPNGQPCRHPADCHAADWWRRHGEQRAHPRHHRGFHQGWRRHLHNTNYDRP